MRTPKSSVGGSEGDIIAEAARRVRMEFYNRTNMTDDL